MQELAKIKLVYNLSRSISTCNIHFNKYAKREGKFISKLMKGDEGKRKWYVKGTTVSHGTQASKKVAVPQSNRRNTVLNKIFMTHITDLMATGEVAPDLLGKGIEISRVSVTADFHLVNVFWLPKDTEERDKLVEESLTKAEGPLRHELSQLRVMGVVPIIKFVRDKQYARFMEIDRRLAMADFGADFVPTDPTLRLTSTPVLNTKLPDEVWNDIQKLEADIRDDELEIAEEPIPEMRNDVLGLDHDRIMAKIKSSMDKSRAAYLNRSLNIANPIPRNMESSSRVMEYLTVKQRNTVFAEFLKKRQLDEKHRKQYDTKRNHDLHDELHTLDELDLDNDDDDDDDNVDHDDDEIFNADIHSENIKDD